MPTKNNAVLTQECHSPKSLWGIFRILSYCTDSIKVVILDLIQDLPRLLFLLRKGVRGRFQIKFGMTHLFNKGAFTLIELLVVVLIIAILAAVALPQYQLFVATSRVKSMLPLAQSLLQSQRQFFLEHGMYASDLSQLDIAPKNCTSDGYRCFIGNVTMQSAGQHYGIVAQANVPAIFIFYNGHINCHAGGSDTTNFQNRVCQRATGHTTVDSPIIGANYYYFNKG